MKKILLISLTLLIMASAAVASPLPCTNNVGLDKYIANFAGINNACQIGDKLFYDFAFSASSNPVGNEPLGSDIHVAPDAGDGFSNPGIIFSSGFILAFPGETMDATITYTVATLSGSSVIQGYALTMAGSHTADPAGLGSGSVTESFSNAPAATPLVTTVGPLGTNINTSSTGFLPWVSSTTVTTQIHLQSPDSGPFDVVTISGIQEHFSENVPEPYETLLIGSGLLFFGLWRKRVRQ